jgi:hypothetical protein
MRRLVRALFAVAVFAVAPAALANYMICWSVWVNGCLEAETCNHYNDDGQFIGRVAIEYQCP